MARKIRQIAKVMGAEIVDKVPETGGGAFGAERIRQVVEVLRERLQPGQGMRPGRPTAKEWDTRSKVPMTSATRLKLQRLARRMSTTDRKVSPMQVAAQLLENAVAVCPDD